ncbi:hypothetical protein cypCar_00026248 [Cyprinus carpio]|nr:hypothetical protein cypCar_00026248 [Cyprinus carpio]
MDLEQEETIATDDDSDDGDADHSRWMLTEHQFSSATVASLRVLSEEITPQIDLQCRTGQSRNTSTTKQQTHSAVVTPTHPVRVRALVNEEGSSSEREPREGNPVHAPSLEKSLPSKRKESPDNKEYNKAFNTPLTTRDKPTLLAKPYISSGKCSNLTMQIKISAVYTGFSGKSGKVLSLKSIHRRNHFGETKLHLAVMKGDIQDIKDLITAGASVNIPDYAGWTPLHEAVQRNKYDKTEILLEAGAEVSCRGHNGITPLHDAIYCQYYKVCKLHTIVLRLKPSPQTSINVLWPLRDQEQDQNSEGSDTSGCLDSDVTVDYIEDYSSSPEHWTLCATQDFSGS